MAGRRKGRWPAPKKVKVPITTPRAELADRAKRKRKPDGIYFDNLKVKT